MLFTRKIPIPRHFLPSLRSSNFCPTPPVSARAAPAYSHRFHSIVISSLCLYSEKTQPSNIIMSSAKRASTGSAASPASKRRKASDSRSAEEWARDERRLMGIHIFTRDLRVGENLSLFNLAECVKVDIILPVFVFTPEQTRDSDYFGEHSFAFLLAALHDLNQSLDGALVVCYGKHSEVIPALVKALPHVHYVTMAEDYTPYAKLREKAIREAIASRCGPEVHFEVVETHNLIEGGLHGLRSGTGTKYKVFTPFYNAAKKLGDSAVDIFDTGRLDDCLSACLHPDEYFTPLSGRDALPFRYSLEQAETDYIKTHKGLVAAYRGLPPPAGGSSPDNKQRKHNLGVDVPATGEAARSRLQTYPFSQYAHNRDRADSPCTLLSPHFKFGLISPSTAFHIVQGRKDCNETAKEGFIRQLYWRDFYQYVTLHFPWVLAGMRNVEVAGGGGGSGSSKKDAGQTLSKQNFSNQNFTQEYSVDDIEWKRDEAALNRWKSGTTGVPLVDAGMREMLQTGFMHNRSRMVVAMFLTKNLLQDWRIGEKFFAQHLVDYDPMSNNGGWQWSASTGADGSPYFRIMNPMNQLNKCDPTLSYVKKFVPELAALCEGEGKKDVLKWEETKSHSKYVGKNGGAAGGAGGGARKINPLFLKKGAAAAQAAKAEPAAGTGASSSSSSSDAGFKYYAPMVDLKKTREAAIAAFKKAGSRKAQGS